MTKPNEYRAYFTLVGDFEPEEVTVSLGILPTEAWKKGDRNERTHLERKFSRWSLYSRLEPSAKLEEQVEDVLAQVRPVADKVASILTKFEGWMQLVGYFNESFPGLTLAAGTVIELASLNIAIDFDF